MREIWGRFTYHGVNHGLFYTAEIGSTRFIYDCGSLSTREVEMAVDGFAGRLRAQGDTEDGRMPIGALVLSHLHLDRVSGLPKLFGVARVELVVLPYLTAVERLLLAFRFHKRRELAWYFELLAGPVRYLLKECGIPKIILVWSSGEDESRDRFAENFEPLHEGRGQIIDVSAMPLDPELERILKTEEDLDDLIRAGLVIPSNHTGRVSVGSWGELLFFVSPIDRKRKERLKSA